MSSLHQPLDHELDAATGELPLTSHQAAHAVLFTNELLCDIVGRLPFKDIVSATGVCNYWREALQSNQHIQEALFLEPAEIREVVCENHRINDLEHPISVDDCMVLCETHPYVYHIICDKIQFPKRRIHAYGEFVEFEHPSGLWRNMFITQPPCKKVIVQLDSSGTFKLVKCERSTGVKLGELYDLVQSILPHRSVEDVLGLITVSGYAGEDCMPREEPFITRCKVLNGEVCRPKKLPVQVASPETEGYEDSDDDQDDYYDWNHDFDGTEEHVYIDNDSDGMEERFDNDYISYGDEYAQYEQPDSEEDGYFQACQYTRIDMLADKLENLLRTK